MDQAKSCVSEHRDPWSRPVLLRFGMMHDAVADAMDGRDHRELRHRGGACHLAFAGDDVNAYFDVEVGLACIAADAFNGPQVLAPDGFALAGRSPSQVKLTRPVFVARAWVDMFMHTDESRIPAMEWRHVV